MPEIINHQDKIRLETNIFQTFAESVLDETAIGKTATIAFVSDTKMRQLNLKFRGKDMTTDVLSFPFDADEFEIDDSFLGDIVISLEQTQRQALENHLTLEIEVKQLILHGILHLLGYDHETDSGEMNKLELQLRKSLKIN